MLRPQLHYHIILPPIWALPVYWCGLFVLLILMGRMMFILLGRLIIFEFLPVLFFAPLIDAFSMLSMTAGHCHYSVQPISGRFAWPIALGYCPCSISCLIRNMAHICILAPPSRFSQGDISCIFFVAHAF